WDSSIETAKVISLPAHNVEEMKLHAAVLLLSVSVVTGKVKCYNCIAPLNTTDWSNYCNSRTFCEGEYCTKGRNAKSNGILYKCSSSPPLVDTIVQECQMAQTETGILKNCYCKNNNFCNSSSTATLTTVAILTFIFLWY
ncbi:hypothetical protein V3C99_004659, partial [Haemonchus contortus]